MDGNTIRQTLLEVVHEFAGKGPGRSHQISVLTEVAKRLEISGNHELEQAILTKWHDLYRTGHIGWGRDFTNPDFPFYHLTDKGRTTLGNVSHDPANIAGYLKYVCENYKLNPIARSYVEEALNTYNNNCFRAAAVMIGAASESAVLKLRDNLVKKMRTLNRKVPSDLTSWRIKKVIDQLGGFVESSKADLPVSLYESFSSYWTALSSQIRMSRNDAGHPASLAPVTEDRVHASLLIFPEFLRLIKQLNQWVSRSYS